MHGLAVGPRAGRRWPEIAVIYYLRVGMAADGKLQHLPIVGGFYVKADKIHTSA